MLRPIVFALTLLTCVSAAHAGTILVFGDSLSAGYGLGTDQSWPSLLAQRLRERSPTLTVVNASISGETSAGGRSRLATALKQHRPEIVILELGANDGLRGLPTDALQDNLTAMVRAARGQGARVLLVGMRLPPNYGPDYTQRFERVFGEVARRERTALLPFLLEPIASDRNAFQADGLHPVAAAQPKILDHVWKKLQPLLK